MHAWCKLTVPRASLSLLTQKRQFLSETPPRPCTLVKGKKCLNLTVLDAFPFMPRVGCQAEVSLSLSLGRRASWGRRNRKENGASARDFGRVEGKGGRRREINFVSLAKLLAEEEEKEEEKGEKEEDAREMKRGKSFLSDGQRNPSYLLLFSPHTLQKLEEEEGGGKSTWPTNHPTWNLPPFTSISFFSRYSSRRKSFQPKKVGRKPTFYPLLSLSIKSASQCISRGGSTAQKERRRWRKKIKMCRAKI